MLMYQIFNIFVDSDIPLPELPKYTPSDQIITVRVGDEKRLKQLKVKWFHDWLDQDKEISISCGKINDNYILKFPNLVDFIISKHGKFVQYFPSTNIPAETIRHLLLDQVIPRVLGQQGRHILHASLVVLQNNKCVAFLGESGRGKSTIASSFAESGAQLITDDCLLFEEKKGRIFGIPNYYGLRLYKDSSEAIFNKNYEFSNVAHYSDKKRLKLHNQRSTKHSSGIKLDTIFLLGDPCKHSTSDLVAINPVKGANKFMAMFEQIFLLDIMDKKIISQQFRNTEKIISAEIPTFRIDYPRKYTLLPAIRESIVKASL